MTKLFDIFVSRNHVEINMGIIDRPSHVSVSEWLEFWEAVNNIESPLHAKLSGGALKKVVAMDDGDYDT